MLDKKVLILLCTTTYQRWIPRGRPWPQGRILKALASNLKSLASNLKSLASKPTSPQKVHVLGSWTALLFDWLSRK